MLVEVSPRRHWWCLGLCSTTKKIELLRCSIVLTGLAGEAQAEKQCMNCGKLTVTGPGFWGFNIPLPFDQVRYGGVARIQGELFSFEGSMVY